MIEPVIAPRKLLGSMVLLQIFWLCASWFLRGGEATVGQHVAFLACSALFGLILLLLPGDFISISQRLEGWLPRKERELILILCTIVLVAGAIYARYNKVFLDEPENFNASKKVIEEGIGAFFSHYSKIPWLGKQHPPLVPLVNAFAMGIFGVDLFVIRLTTLIFAIATLIVTYSLGKALYDRRIGFLSASIFIGFPFLLCLGAAALSDIQVTFFFSLAMLLALRLKRNPTCSLAGALGLAMGLGILTKYTMIFIFPVLFILLLTEKGSKRFGWHFVMAALVSIVVVAPWIFYCWSNRILALQEKTITRYSKAVTLGSGGTKYLWQYLFRGIPRGFGPYNIPMLLLGGVRLLQRREEGGVFLLLWIVPVFLLLLVTLPDPRYFMPAFPALAVIAALGLNGIPGSRGRIIALAWLFCGILLFRFAVIGAGRLH